MNFADCIDEAVAKGDLGADAGARARKRYDRAYADAASAFGPTEGDRMAAEAVIADLEAAATEAERRRLLTVRRRTDLLAGIDQFKARRGRAGGTGGGAGGGQAGGGRRGQPKRVGGAFARALELIVENKPGQAGAPFPSIEGRYRALRGEADAMMAGLIERFETRTGMDAPNRATLRAVVREAFGEPTNDSAAKALAEAWAETAEYLRGLFNAAGGSIGKMDGWGLPQAHDAYAVRAVGRDAWIAFVRPRLAVERMRASDGSTLSDATIDEALGEVWESIASLGANAREAGASMGQGAVASRHREARFLIFRSADDWIAYQEQFGDGDPFSVMMGHIDELSRDIAQMQILGPNADTQWRWLKNEALRQALEEEAAGVSGAADAAKSHVATAENMLGFFTGSLSTPVNSKLASFGVSTRAYLTSTALGSAILSDIPTAPVFGALARSFSGLSATGDAGRFARLLVPTGGDVRAIARRAGFINEQATDGLIRATQDNLRLLTVGERLDGGLNVFARRLPAAVLRMQGLTGYTAARKRSFHFEFMGALGDRSGMTLAQMKAGDGEDQAFAQFLEARGFSSDDWDAARRTPLWEPEKGAAFLRPLDIEDRELGMRLTEAIEMETRFAVPETSLWTRAKLIGESRPGTVSGEVRRSWAMFRSFTLTAAHLYAEEFAVRGMQRGVSPFMASAAGLGGLFVFLTMAGAVTIQMRTVASGNDPRDMTDPKFWGQAVLQGGGLWILGDFIFSAEQRSDSQLAAFGPVGAATGDAYGATLGNAVDIGADLSDGKTVGEAMGEANIGRDASRLLRRYTPGANIWWLRAAWNRSVVDQVQRLLDPDAEADFQAAKGRIERENGAGQWWPSGEPLPDRLPAMAAAG